MIRACCLTTWQRSHPSLATGSPTVINWVLWVHTNWKWLSILLWTKTYFLVEAYMFLSYICCQATANECHMCLATEDPQPNNNPFSTKHHKTSNWVSFVLLLFSHVIWGCLTTILFPRNTLRMSNLPSNGLSRCINWGLIGHTLSYTALRHFQLICLLNLILCPSL